jgi:hypothetical protein
MMVRDSPYPELVTTAAFAKIRNIRAVPAVNHNSVVAPLSTIAPALISRPPAIGGRPTVIVGGGQSQPGQLLSNAASGQLLSNAASGPILPSPSTTSTLVGGGATISNTLFDKLKITLTSVEKSYLISIIAVALVILFCVASMKMKQHKRFKENNTNFKWFI